MRYRLCCVWRAVRVRVQLVGLLSSFSRHGAEQLQRLKAVTVSDYNILGAHASRTAMRQLLDCSSNCNLGSVARMHNGAVELVL
jgi:hypothetical protein